MSAESQALHEALRVQLEAGADEAILDLPLNRFDAAEPEILAQSQPVKLSQAPKAEPNQDTTALAASAQNLEELQSLVTGFEGCALKKGARNCVFSDGNPKASLMVIGEAPGAEEDRQGKPFVGRSGQLLDRMLAAIGLERHAEDPLKAVYITNVIPWRPPGNRDPSADETAMMRPFLMRHIALAQPKVLLLLGNPSMKTVLNVKEGITRMRGTWADVHGIPALPSFHPAALLRDPLKKRLSWQDLQSLHDKLQEG